MAPSILRKKAGMHSRGPQRFLRRVFAITLIPVTLAGVIFLFLSLYLVLRGAPFLRLKEINIRGNRRVSTEEIVAMAELEDRPNILALDLKALNRRLGEHPWIERAMTKRIFPDGLRIVIQERQPVAIVRLDELYYIDEKAVIFDRIREDDKGIYPTITGIHTKDLEGKEAKARMLIQEAVYFLKMTQHAALLPYRSISRIHLDGAIGLRVYTTNGRIEIRMGFGDFKEKFQRLAKTQTFLRSFDLSYIDCTVPEKIIIRKKRAEE